MKMEFSSHIRNIRRDRVQSHIWLTASSIMTKYLRTSSYIRKPFLIYDFAPDPFWISLYCMWGKIFFYFLSVLRSSTCKAFFADFFYLYRLSYDPTLTCISTYNIIQFIIYRKHKIVHYVFLFQNSSRPGSYTPWTFS